MELIDVVNPATGERLSTADRRAVHSRGDWHQVFHCLVLRPEAKSIVLQRRSEHKAAFPGLLDLSVTGHLEAGESPSDGVREFAEELGVDVEPTALVPVGTRLLADDNGEGQNRERVHVFFVLDDRPLTDYRPPAHEVAGLVEVRATDLLALLSDPTLSVDVNTTNASAPESEVGGTIGQADLVEGADGYWTVLAVMAARALDGETLLSV